MRPLSALFCVAAATAPPLELFPGTNVAFTLNTGPGPSGQHAGESGPFIKFVAPHAPTLAACAAAAAAWSNASAPADRCLSAAWFRAPPTASWALQCYCLVSPKFIPAPSAGVDSARLLWPCADDADCSLNGACSAATGACACDPGWRGARCGELALLPVDAAAPGLRATDAGGRNVSTWGAPMLRDEATGLWHAWPSEMQRGCGLNSWKTNSHIVHYTAASPGGPWARGAEAFPAFAHEPGVVRGPAGELVMIFSSFALANASDACTACANGVTLALAQKGGCGPDAAHGFKTLLAVAPGFGAPWGAPLELHRLNAQWDWNTAAAIQPNGSAVALLRGGFAWAAGAYADAAAWAPAGGAPGMGVPLPDANIEDPFVYRDARGRFHAILHAMDVGDDPSFCGGHAFSADGVAWTYTGFAFGNVANYSDGTARAFSRRERPHLLFARDGVTPLALSSGVQFDAPAGVACTIGGRPAACDPVFTLVQPIAGSA
jgi:hypothetical protein